MSDFSSSDSLEQMIKNHRPNKKRPAQKKRRMRTDEDFFDDSDGREGMPIKETRSMPLQPANDTNFINMDDLDLDSSGNEENKPKILPKFIPVLKEESYGRPLNLYQRSQTVSTLLPSPTALQRKSGSTRQPTVFKFDPVDLYTIEEENKKKNFRRARQSLEIPSNLISRANTQLFREEFIGDNRTEEKINGNNSNLKKNRQLTLGNLPLKSELIDGMPLKKEIDIDSSLNKRKRNSTVKPKIKIEEPNIDDKTETSVKNSLRRKRYRYRKPINDKPKENDIKGAVNEEVIDKISNDINKTIPRRRSKSANRKNKKIEENQKTENSELNLENDTNNIIILSKSNNDPTKAKTDIDSRQIIFKKETNDQIKEEISNLIIPENDEMIKTAKPVMKKKGKRIFSKKLIPESNDVKEKDSVISNQQELKENTMKQKMKTRKGKSRRQKSRINLEISSLISVTLYSVIPHELKDEEIVFELDII